MKLENFWLKESEIIDWSKIPKKVLKKQNNNYKSWFPDGKLNVYHNCVTKYLKKGLSKKIAIYFVNKDKKINYLTYEKLDSKVKKCCNFLSRKLKKNFQKKRIMIHASASEESSVLMLASCRMGIHFSVIFEDLPVDAIIKRVNLFNPDLFFSRFKKKDFFKKIIKKTKINSSDIISYQEISSKKNDNFNFSENNFDSSKDLFTLFTSGTTGEPKGITHSSGGYLLYSKHTCYRQFGMNKNSIVLTASDAGWINGHTYALFGPLSFGSTTILIESPFLLLDESLMKNLLSLKVSILYLPVTLIRLCKKIYSDEKINIKTLKTLGSMGEPLAPSIGTWFSKKFGLANSAIVNTYFQTETGGIISSPNFKDSSKSVPHGSVGKPVNKFIKLNTLSKNEKKEIKILVSWPGCMKNVINGRKEWDKYWDQKGNFRLFDLATVKDQNIFIHGRNDDVVNIRGHRLGSEELESTVLKTGVVNECCAVSIPDKLEGNVLYLFLVSDNKNLDSIVSSTILNTFGSYALPKKIFYLTELPKTRSGKILRRLVRSILLNPKTKNFGDLSTILNENIVKEISKNVQKIK